MSRGPDPIRPATVEIENLNVAFGAIRAVNGVSLRLEQGEVVALIGESGSGKSVTMRSIMNLHGMSNARISGTLKVNGRDVLSLTRRELADMRGREVSMIFQEPLLALDPVYTIGQQISEAIRRHEKITRAEARARALKLLERMQIPSPERRLAAYPHELSGGMRQRAMIALALACRPKLLLADEPTTALDASVQIQILLLLRQLQRDLGLSILFVTHDIDVAAEIADRIAVMYAGRIVEEGATAELVRCPRHPYTIALLRSRHKGRGSKGSRLETIEGRAPDLLELPPGCSFADRCPHVAKICHVAPPPVVELGQGHVARCLRLDQTAPFAMN